MFYATSPLLFIVQTECQIVDSLQSNERYTRNNLMQAQKKSIFNVCLTENEFKNLQFFGTRKINVCTFKFEQSLVSPKHFR